MYKVLMSKSENLDTKHGVFRLTLKLVEYGVSGEPKNQSWNLTLSTLRGKEINTYFIDAFQTSKEFLNRLEKDILFFVETGKKIQ